MAKFATALKEEILRVARKETKSQVTAARKSAAQHRRHIAALRREITVLARKVAFLENQEKKRAASKSSAEPEEVRFSPRWVKAHRAKLGLSAQDYGKLLGVSSLTVYNWENGKSRPRASLLPALADVRALRKREAMRRLELLTAQRPLGNG